MGVGPVSSTIEEVPGEVAACGRFPFSFCGLAGSLDGRRGADQHNGRCFVGGSPMPCCLNTKSAALVAFLLVLALLPERLALAVDSSWKVDAASNKVLFAAGAATIGGPGGASNVVDMGGE